MVADRANTIRKTVTTIGLTSRSRQHRRERIVGKGLRNDPDLAEVAAGQVFSPLDVRLTALGRLNWGWRKARSIGTNGCHVAC
jgi:hypothetical protein